MQALEKEREDRYRSAEEMERAITAVLDSWRAERERERAEAARLAAEAGTTRLAAERTERERAEATRLAVVRAEQERLAREEAERKKQEQAARHPPRKDYGGTTRISGERSLRRMTLTYAIAGFAVALAAAAFFIARYMAEKPVREVAHQAASVPAPKGESLPSVTARPPTDTPKSPGSMSAPQTGSCPPRTAAENWDREKPRTSASGGEAGSGSCSPGLQRASAEGREPPVGDRPPANRHAEKPREHVRAADRELGPPRTATEN